MPVIITTSHDTCNAPNHSFSGRSLTRIRCRMLMVIHKITIGRKKRGEAPEGTYGQATPTARISPIISSRTRVSHSNHSRRLNVCSMGQSQSQNYPTTLPYSYLRQKNGG